MVSGHMRSEPGQALTPHLPLIFMSSQFPFCALLAKELTGGRPNLSLWPTVDKQAVLVSS